MIDRRFRDWPPAWRHGLVLVLIAAALRAVGLGFGLPHAVDRPDEETIVGNILRLETVNDWNPKFFAYPSALLYAGYGGF